MSWDSISTTITIPSWIASIQGKKNSDFRMDNWTYIWKHCTFYRYSSNQDHFYYIKDFSQFLVHDTFKSYYLSHYSHLIDDLQKYELMIPRSLPRNIKSKLICEAISNILNKLELHELGLEHAQALEDCGKVKTKLTEKLTYFQNQILNSNSFQGKLILFIPPKHNLKFRWFWISKI